MSLVLILSHGRLIPCLQHHSALSPDDGVLLGVNNIRQVDTNIRFQYMLEPSKCVIRQLTVYVVRVGHFWTMLLSFGQCLCQSHEFGTALQYEVKITGCFLHS